MKVPQGIPQNVWVLGFGSLLNDISSEMIHSLLPLFLVSSLGAGTLTVGLIEGTAEATASVVKIFSGALSDYLGQRKNLLVLGYGLSTLVKPLFALATTPAWVLAARFGDRVGKGIRVAPRDALVADTTPPALRGAAYGLRQSLDSIGAFLGPLIASALMLAWGGKLRWVFWAALIPGVLAVVLLAAGVREPQNQKYQLEPGAGQRRTQPLHWHSLRRLQGAYWLLLGVALLFNLGNSSDAFLLLKAEQLGIATPLVPLGLVVVNLAYAASAYPVGVLSDRLGRVGLLVAGFLLYALVYLGFAVAQSPWQVWGLFALYGLHLGLSQGVLLALVADRVPGDLRGTALGFLNLAVGVALLPASLLAGSLWQHFGSGATFAIGSIFAVAAAVLLWVFRPAVGQQ
ncbi:MFS transporter [Leptolyngbya sp. FACHB-261]|uniref:MFS transporter n=1 Tax=Leptolyngbya sp. FACHB-261 TaxID=2692806 RepID=UPI001683B760|nr:MFS transporter [Leptolyngbya sp. FACHB-261]MBD2104501.1 MFS transporter [Leptolyngbya sp. FACHB-261]